MSIKEELKSLHLQAIEVKAGPGVEWGRGLQEAMLLACREWSPVVYEHNGKKMLVDPCTMLDAVQEIGKKK